MSDRGSAQRIPLALMALAATIVLATGCGGGGTSTTASTPTTSTQPGDGGQQSTTGPDCATGGGEAQAARSGPGTDAGGPFFSAGSPWNTPVAEDAALDPAGKQLTGELKDMAQSPG